MAEFRIYTDSCSDLSTELRKEYDIDYCRMGVVVDGEDLKADLDWKVFSVEEFYGWISSGRKVKTSQVSIQEFQDCWEPVLKAGKDIIYIGCSSMLSSSVNTAAFVAKELLEQYPDRKIIVIDSLNSSGCEGMMTIDAAVLRKQGKSLEEVAKWVEDNKLKYNQFCTIDTLKYLKNAGRVKGPKAFMGDLFHKKPIFISDKNGNNYTIGTVTGNKNADKELVQGCVKAFRNNESPCQRIVIGRATDNDRALDIAKQIEDILHIKPEIWTIGPIIGASCGPGIVAAQCFGAEVTRYEGEENK